MGRSMTCPGSGNRSTSRRVRDAPETSVEAVSRTGPAPGRVRAVDVRARVVDGARTAPPAPLPSALVSRQPDRSAGYAAGPVARVTEVDWAAVRGCDRPVPRTTPRHCRWEHVTGDERVRPGTPPRTGCRCRGPAAAPRRADRPPAAAGRCGCGAVPGRRRRCRGRCPGHRRRRRGRCPAPPGRVSTLASQRDGSTAR